MTKQELLTKIKHDTDGLAESIVERIHSENTFKTVMVSMGENITYLAFKDTAPLSTIRFEVLDFLNKLLKEEEEEQKTLKHT